MHARRDRRRWSPTCSASRRGHRRTPATRRRTRLGRAVARARRTHERRACVVLRDLRARTARARARRLAAAHEVLEPLVAFVRAQGMCEPGATWCVGDEIEALVGLDRPAEAEALLDWYEANADRFGRLSAQAIGTSLPRPARGRGRRPAAGHCLVRGRARPARAMPAATRGGADAPRARLSPTQSKGAASRQGDARARRGTVRRSRRSALARADAGGARPDRWSCPECRRADARRAEGRRTRSGRALEQGDGCCALSLDAHGRRAPLARLRKARRPVAGRAGATARRPPHRRFQSQVVPRFFAEAASSYGASHRSLGPRPGQRRRHEGTRHIALALVALALCVPIAGATPDSYQPQLRGRHVRCRLTPPRARKPTEPATDVVDRAVADPAVEHRPAGFLRPGPARRSARLELLVASAPMQTRADGLRGFGLVGASGPGHGRRRCRRRGGHPARAPHRGAPLRAPPSGRTCPGPARARPRPAGSRSRRPDLSP